MASDDGSLPPAESHRFIVCELHGDWDFYQLPRLLKGLRELDEGGHRNIIADVRELDFFDSAALGALVGAYKRAHARGGSVVFLRPSERFRKVLAITGLDRVFCAFADVGQAVAHLEQLNAAFAAPSPG